MKMVSGGSMVPAIGLFVFVGCLPMASCADRHDLSSSPGAGTAGAGAAAGNVTSGGAGGGGATSAGGNAGDGATSSGGDAGTAGDGAISMAGEGSGGASEGGSGGEASVRECGSTGATCDDDNVCTSGETCQESDTCGGGTKQPLTTPCGNNEFCNGNGACECRTKSSWNLLTNPGFNGSADGWTLGAGAAYATNDVDGCAGSGSLSLPALSSFRQCVPAQPSKTYYFGFRFKASGGPSSTGTAHCYISFLPAGNTCQVGDATDSVSTTQDYNNDNWIQGSGTGTSDSNTTHILMACSTPSAVGYHDQLYLSQGSPGVPAF